jgi:hypothetical protein
MELKCASCHARGHDVVNQKSSSPNRIYAGFEGRFAANKIGSGSFPVWIFLSSKAQNNIYFRDFYFRALGSLVVLSFP